MYKKDTTNNFPIISDIAECKLYCDMSLIDIVGRRVYAQNALYRKINLTRRFFSADHTESATIIISTGF